ncbi:hypothetical protein TSMEX_009092 [Taenia solium]|eukprot:TsM_001150700 transcript=TsM_001150700 gene=TsM_001150700
MASMELSALQSNLSQAWPTESIPVNEATVGLNLMPVLQCNALGFLVTVGADLTISLYIAEGCGPSSVQNSGTLTVKTLRTNPASFLPTNLTVYQSYTINIMTSFSVDHNAMGSYIVRLIPKGHGTTPSSYTTLTTVLTSTPKGEEGISTETNGAMSEAEAASTTVQRKTCYNMPKLPPFLALNSRGVNFVAIFGGSFSNKTEKVQTSSTCKALSQLLNRQKILLLLTYRHCTRREDLWMKSPDHSF